MFPPPPTLIAGGGIGQTPSGGDINGDGYTDLVVGAPSATVVYANEGAVYCFFGGPNGITATSPSQADSSIRGGALGAQFPLMVRVLGDVNGDGFADIVVRKDGGPNRVLVFYGSAQGFTASTAADADATITSEASVLAVNRAGDLNDDGYDDLVFASYVSTGSAWQGRLHVTYGGPTGIASGTVDDVCTTFLGPIYNDAFWGQFVSPAGDVNADGYDDVAVSGGSSRVYFGSAIGLTGAFIPLSSEAAAGAGGSVSGDGDFDGDGFSDVVAAKMRYSYDDANVPTSVWRGASPQPFFSTINVTTGGIVQTIGDFDADGRSDFIANVREGSNSSNLLDIIYGAPTPPIRRRQLAVAVGYYGPDPSFGRLGDINGDGFDDVAVGYPYSSAGAVYVWYGQPRDGACTAITCDGDVQAAAAPDACGAAVSYVVPAGGPCGKVTCVPTSGSFFEVGVTTVTCSSPYGGACSFDVTVTDETPPTLSCPPSVSANTAPGSCDAAVTFTVSATDNCDGATVTCLPPSGSFFVRGTTTVTCTATDASANVASCSFPVVVSDAELPSLSVPEAISTTADAGACSAVVSFSASGTDNCGDPEVSCVPSSGATFPVGITTVTCTATDASANVSSGSFTVTVVDAQPPTLSCPTSVAVTTSAGSCMATVSYLATVADNCSDATIACTPSSGSSFPRGTTTVTCTASDAHQNSATCSFVVTVADVEAPSVACGGPVIVPSRTHLGSQVMYTLPSATDACGEAPVVCDPASGSLFPIGTTTVTCTATDTSGNTSTCGFDVTVLPLGSDTIGIYVPASGAFFLRNSITPGGADSVFTYGPAGAGWIALRGDWDGDGIDSPGVYDPTTGFFFLKNDAGPGPADLVFGFGAGGPGVLPLVGDFDGDGTDTVGIYAVSTGAFFLKNSNSSGAADLVFTYGPGGVGVEPFVGDFDGDGTDTIGIYAVSTGAFFLKNTNASGAADSVFTFGAGGAGVTPLFGDYDGNGIDSVGIYVSSTGAWFLKNANGPGAADYIVGYGPPGSSPLVGDWDGN